MNSSICTVGTATICKPSILKSYTIIAEFINQIKAQVAAISSDIDKVDNKAARARVRKATLRLEKLGKVYRKESIG